MIGGDDLDEGKGMAELDVSQAAKKNCWDLQPLRDALGPIVWNTQYILIATIMDRVSLASQEHPGSSAVRMNTQGGGRPSHGLCFLVQLYYHSFLSCRLSPSTLFVTKILWMNCSASEQIFWELVERSRKSCCR